MEEDIYLKKLAQRNIKPTAMRLLILRAMMQFDRAFSLLDLETYLDTVYKSTLSETSSDTWYRRRFRFTEICSLRQ